MKRGAPLSNLFAGFFLIFSYLGHEYTFLMVGTGIFSIVTGLFEFKNYHNNKLYLAITGIILIFSLIIAYIQLSSPLYHGNRLFNYFFTIFFTFIIIMAAYDFTHDYKISKIQMKDQKPLIRHCVLITVLVTGLIVGIWLGSTI